MKSSILTTFLYYLAFFWLLIQSSLHILHVILDHLIFMGSVDIKRSFSSGIF